MKKTLLIILSVFLFSATAVAEQNFNTLLRSAQQGDVEAMCDLGIAYYYGRGTLKDPFKAKCWVQKAYQLGLKRAEQTWAELELWQYSGKCDSLSSEEIRSRFVQGDDFFEPVTGHRFIYLATGCFEMGCPDGSKKCVKNETPGHTVCLDGFWIGATEVDQALWVKIMGSNPSRFANDLSRPVENVSFKDVERFIQRLNQISGQTFSLPTEAQWEYACTSGGTNAAFPWQGDGYRPHANCGNCRRRTNASQTLPVATFPPNKAGLYDMGGNVKEWCRDVYDKKAYAEHAEKNPEYTGKGALRVLRGGSFTDNARKLRCRARDKSIPGMGADNIGFRLVLVRKP